MKVSNRWIKAASFFLCAFLLFGIISSINCNDVYAADSTCNVSTWGDEGQVSGSASGYSDGSQYAEITIEFSKGEVFCDVGWNCTIVSGGNGGDTVTIRTTQYNTSWGITVNGTSLDGMTASVTSVTVGNFDNTATTTAATTTAATTAATTVATNTPTPRPTATNTPRPAATNTPRPAATNTPRPAATNTPRPAATNTPRPAATNTPRPAATNTPRPAATNTPRPAATNTPRPVATATPIPSSTPDSYGEGVIVDNNVNPGNSDGAAADVSVETTETSETSETTETSVDQEIIGDGETPNEVDEAIVLEAISDDSADDAVVEGEGTPTPTPVRVGGIIKPSTPDEKSGFPWWIVILLALLGAGGYRYYSLKQQNVTGKDMVYDFIPGGVIGNVAEKFFPSKPSTPVSTESAPEVVNGYLKTSNTKVIRPMYSNAPSTRAQRGVNNSTITAVNTVNKPSASTSNVARPTASSASTAAKTSASKPVENKVPLQQRPPIKRPANLSVNRAAAIATSEAKPTVTSTVSAASAAKASVKPVENKVPLQQRPPIKRPANLSVNRAAATAAAATVAAKDEKMTETKPAENQIPSKEKEPIMKPASSVGADAPVRPRSAFNRTAPASAATSTTTATSVAPVQRPPVKRPASASANRAASKKSEDTMNRPGSSTLNVNATATPAALAFEKAQQENKVKPSIATAPVAPVIEKKEEGPAINPFKTVIPTDKTTASAKNSFTTTTKAKTAEDYFIPMKNAAKEEVSPFKSNGLKEPIKRPASASVNRAQAASAEATSTSSAVDTKRMSINQAMTKETRHTEFKVTEFKEQEKINPFKSNVPSDSSNEPKKPFNAAAAMKELRQMEENETSNPTPSTSSYSAPASTMDNLKDSIGGFLGKFKK